MCISKSIFSAARLHTVTVLEPSFKRHRFGDNAKVVSLFFQEISSISWQTIDSSTVLFLLKLGYYRKILIIFCIFPIHKETSDHNIYSLINATKMFAINFRCSPGCLGKGQKQTRQNQKQTRQNKTGQKVEAVGQ